MARSSCGCGMRRKPLPVETFNEVWKLATSGSAPNWKPQRLAIGSDRVVRAAGATWYVTTNISVGQRELEAMVLVVLQPPKPLADTPPRRRLAMIEFLYRVARQLRAAGYEGDVEDAFGRISAGFHKSLADVDAVRREIRRLSDLHLGGK
jgi:hypothetical protein